MTSEVRPAFSVASQLIELAAELYAMDPWNLPRADNRRANFRPRFAVIWTLRQLVPENRQTNPYSYTRLGRLLGYADHTTAWYAERQIDKLRAIDPKLKALTDKLLDFALSQYPQVKAAA